MPSSISEIKNSIRASVRAQRNALTPEQVAVRGKQLTQQLKQLVTQTSAHTISSYLPVRNEPDTSGFNQWALSNGADLLLPSCREDKLLDWIRPQDLSTVPGLHGIPEPVGEVLSPLSLDSAQLLLVPACAVDNRGVRLGWGGGYYDRTLGSITQLPHVFAVVYDTEILPEIPQDTHDIPVTGVVTPTLIHFF